MSYFVYKNILYSNLFKTEENAIEFQINPILVSKANISNLKTLLESYLSTSDKVILAVSNKQQYDTVANILKDEKIDFCTTEGLQIPKKHIGITIYSLEEGFELPSLSLAVISSKELFGFQNRSSRFLNRFKEATIIRNYEELKPGDYVVHEYHGIGKFIDIETIEVDGVHRDFIHIKYAGTSTLFIPLTGFFDGHKYLVCISCFLPV